MILLDLTPTQFGDSITVMVTVALWGYVIYWLCYEDQLRREG